MRIYRDATETVGNTTLVKLSRVAARPESEGELIVVILPDTGERYLSTGLFD